MVKNNYLHAIKLITNEIRCFCLIIRVVFYLFSVNRLEACYLSFIFSSKILILEIKVQD